MKREDFLKKIETTEVYLLNSYEKARIRILGNVAWIKFAGEPEYLAKPGSEIVTDAILEQNEISKEDYQKV